MSVAVHPPQHLKSGLCVACGGIRAVRYYGDTIALYFAWMQHFTVWLIPPAIVGALITLLGGEGA